jgi:adenylate cyclase
MGWMQPLELAVYDTLRVESAGAMRDHHILLVGATEADLERWGYPIPDGVLAALLERIASQKPRIIGVDLFRNWPVPPGSDRLDEVIAGHPEIVWVFKLSDGTRRGVPPPAPLKGTSRAVLADLAIDAGDIVRRGLLFADDGVTNYSGMGTALALGYLQRQGVRLEASDGDRLRLGKAVLAPLDEGSEPYVRVDNGGFQTLLDFKGGAQPFDLVSFSDIADRDAAASLAGDRAIIVGTTADSVQDAFNTPFSSQFRHGPRVPGIAIHAHLADQLIRQSSGEDPALEAWPPRGEILFSWCAALFGALLGAVICSHGVRHSSARCSAR